MNSETRVYATVAKDRLVEEGDPEAAFLVATPGSEVPAEYVHLYQEYRKAKDAPVSAEAKAVEAPPENKARAQAEKK